MGMNPSRLHRQRRESGGVENVTDENLSLAGTTENFVRVRGVCGRGYAMPVEAWERFKKRVDTEIRLAKKDAESQSSNEQGAGQS